MLPLLSLPGTSGDLKCDTNWSELAVKIINYECKSLWLSIFRSWIIPDGSYILSSAEYRNMTIRNGGGFTIKLNGQGTLGDCILFRDILCQNHYITFGWAMGMPLNMNVWQSLWAAVVGGVPSCYSNYSAEDKNKSQSGSGEFITEPVLVQERPNQRD